MAIKLTAESFLQVLRQSGLIDKDQLSKLLPSYAARGVDVKKSQDLADAMIADNSLTRWQSEKLLAGRHKGFFLGKYRLLDLLGKGGMSSVYLAEHVLMKRRCAIKVLPSKRVHDSSYLARFHREAQAVASVDHPNIVRAYDVDSAQDRDNQIHFLVMEYVSGRSLQEIVNQDGPQGYVTATEFIRQAADGLDHAHKAGLVHRDIKPGNLLVDNSGTVKILDLGLARFFDDRDENPLTVAHDEKVLGTADYLAPEQALDSHTVDTRADIYSLGCSLYFLLTGHPPFTEGTLAQRLMWHQTKVFPPVTNERPDCPQPLLRILAKMVSKQPEDRQNSAAEVAAACAQWLIENGGTEWKKRHPALLRASTSGTKLPAPSSDPRTDAAVKTSIATNVNKASSVISQDLGGTAATKISKPGSALKPGSRVKPPPSTKITEFPATVVPAVAHTPVEIRVPPPVAQPIIAQPFVAPVAPPLAKPVIPVAAPVATPVVPSLPVAQPGVPSVPVAAPLVCASSSLPVTTAIAPLTDVEQASPDSTVAVDFPESASATFNFLDNFAEQPVETDAPTVRLPVASDTTAVADIESPLDQSAEGDIFSLFGGASDVQNATQPDTASLPSSAEPTSTTLPHSESDAVPLITTDDQLVSSTPARQTTKSAKSAPAWKQPKVLAAVAGALMVIIGLGVWLSGGLGSTSKSSTTKQNSSKSLANGTSAKLPPSQKGWHEVAIRVGPGAGGEYKYSSIGRALKAIVDGREDYEKQAKGKLRFVISVVASKPYEESIVVDESFPGDLHLKSESDKLVKLTASGNDPIITVKGLKGFNGVTVENLFLEGRLGTEVAVLISGSAARCRIKNVIVSGFGRAGIELDAAKGADGADGIVIEEVTFQKSGPVASGIHFLNSTDPSQHVTLQRCRFLSTMAAAVFVEGPVESLTARNCGVAGTTSGFRFAAGAVVKNLLIENCSFLSVADAGILFDDQPPGGSGEFCWRNNLFSGMKKTELLIAKNYDGKKFDSLLSTTNAVENNWSDRAGTQTVAGERDLILDNRRRVSKIEYASTVASGDGFLAPKTGTPYKSAGVKGKQ